MNSHIQQCHNIKEYPMSIKRFELSWSGDPTFFESVEAGEFTGDPVEILIEELDLPGAACFTLTTSGEAR
ncbi:MAG: hypothetical protein WCQ50_05260 [Spirochaetota bacterium]